MKSRFEFPDNKEYEKYLRTYFAALAMQGLLANPEYISELKINYKQKVITDMNLMLTRESIDMADELLKQLES